MTFRRLIVGLTVAVATCAVTVAFAAPGKVKAKAGTDAPTCPAGGSYRLSTKPSKSHPTAVKYKGKTYYVCAQCAKDVKAGKLRIGSRPKAAKSAAQCATCPMSGSAAKKGSKPASCPMQGGAASGGTCPMAGGAKAK